MMVFLFNILMFGKLDVIIYGKYLYINLYRFRFNIKSIIDNFNINETKTVLSLDITILIILNETFK